MGKVDLLADAQPVAGTGAEGRGGPFADAVHGEHRRFLERGREKGRCRVREVVLGEQQALRREIGIDALKLTRQELALEQLLLQPHRQRDAEGGETAGREREVGLEQPLEFEERLVVEHHVVELGQPAAGLGHTIGDRARGKAGVVLLAGEALLLGGRNDAPVNHDGGSAVVIERRDPEDAHRAVRTRCR